MQPLIRISRAAVILCISWSQIFRENRRRGDFWPLVREPPELPPDPAREERIEARRRLLSEQTIVAGALVEAYRDANRAATQRAERREMKRRLLSSRFLPQRIVRFALRLLRLGGL